MWEFTLSLSPDHGCYGLKDLTHELIKNRQHVNRTRNNRNHWKEKYITQSCSNLIFIKLFSLNQIYFLFIIFILINSIVFFLHSYPL